MKATGSRRTVGACSSRGRRLPGLEASAEGSQRDGVRALEDAPRGRSRIRVPRDSVARQARARNFACARRWLPRFLLTGPPRRRRIPAAEPALALCRPTGVRQMVGPSVAAAECSPLWTRISSGGSVAVLLLACSIDGLALPRRPRRQCQKSTGFGSRARRRHRPYPRSSWSGCRAISVSSRRDLKANSAELLRARRLRALVAGSGTARPLATPTTGSSASSPRAWDWRRPTACAACLTRRPTTAWRSCSTGSTTQRCRSSRDISR